MASIFERVSLGIDALRHERLQLGLDDLVLFGNDVVNCLDLLPRRLSGCKVKPAGVEGALRGSQDTSIRVVDIGSEVLQELRLREDEATVCVGEKVLVRLQGGVTDTKGVDGFSLVRSEGHDIDQRLDVGSVGGSIGYGEAAERVSGNNDWHIALGVEGLQSSSDDVDVVWESGERLLHRCDVVSGCLETRNDLGPRGAVRKGAVDEKNACWGHVA